MQSVIRKADKEDLKKVREFLTNAQLGTEGLTEESMDYFLLLEDGDGNIRGSLGMDVFARFGLLRSLVVTSGQAEKEILILLNQMLQLAMEKRMVSLFLATNKSAALPFFEVLGFQRLEQEELPSEFYSAEHIKHILNVDNSYFLKISL
jgi:amino-acid N-acetyltransferase